jgi:RNA polymerase sigma factor (sigma-70 family)
VSPGPAIEDLLRDLAPQVLVTVIRRFGHFDAAEDAVQEALLAAALHWPRDGVPDNPRGWLIQTAARRMTDALRSEQARRRREIAAATSETPAPDVPARDETLTLFFMCCHPALTPASAISLTLRAVGGLTTAEIAAAFLVPEATMAQRISRAKQRIKSSGVPFQMRRSRTMPRACAPSSTSSTSSSTRATRAAPAPDCTAPSCRARPSGWRGWCATWCPTTVR